MVFTCGPTRTARRQAVLAARYAKSAAAQVFGTVEFMEEILLCLPIRDVLVNVTRVSKHWNSIVEVSTKLQHALFFSPLPGGHAHFYVYYFTQPFSLGLRPRILKSFWARGTSGPATTMMGNPFFPEVDELEKEHTRLWLKNSKGELWGHHAKKFAAISREDASWRKMLPLQPAVEEIALSDGTHVNPSGLRMGDLYSPAVRVPFTANYRDCAYAHKTIPRTGNQVLQSKDYTRPPSENACVEVWGIISRW